MKRYIIRVKKIKSKNCLGTVRLVLTFNTRRVKANWIEVLGFFYPRDPKREVALNCYRLGYLLNKGVCLHSSAWKFLVDFCDWVPPKSKV